MSYEEMSAADLARIERLLEQRYRGVCGPNRPLDLTRGKPAVDQLDLSDALDGILDGNYLTVDGTDVRNYGGLRGIAEARSLGAEILDLEPNQVIAGGNSSLSLIYLTVETALRYGLNGPAWQEHGSVKAICPVPGFDRHFTLTESFGIEMIAVPMTPTGPDMNQVEALVDSDPSVKCIWCVPKYSNPTGCIYSADTVRRIAQLGTLAADGFLVLWDNAYAVHDFDFPPPKLENILTTALAAGTQDTVAIFGSTSKITFAGSGVGFVAGSENTLTRLEERLSVMTIGPDKINQLRHTRLLNGRVEAQMRKHADIIRPKFEAVERTLTEALGGSGLATWTAPRGGYFVSLNTMQGVASAAIELAAPAGLNLTPAGATYPYRTDPNDRTIRLAPTFAMENEVETATDILALCIKLASVRALSRAHTNQ
jgi:aspartate/methionine/tyrosine aminotransferase